MTSAIGPFAVDSGLVECEKNDRNKTVRIRNTNTGKLIDASFPIEDGEAVVRGEFEIDGVAGQFTKIRLAFLDPAGSKTGKFLPTGNVVDTFDGVAATCVDVGNPCVFLQASDLGVEGGILPDAIDANKELLDRLARIRRKASVAMGFSSSESSTPGSVPKIAFVSRSQPHALLSGQVVDEKNTDLVVRAMSVGQPHRAVPITVAMALAAASKVERSVVYRNTTNQAVDPDGVTIGHPSGRLLVSASFDKKGVATEAIVYRTARRLMEGTVFWK